MNRPDILGQREATIDDAPAILSMPVYTVQRLDGTTFVAKSVESFETLVTEHERKAAKFRAILNQF